MNCVLCQLSKADVVYSTDCWQVVTNHNVIPHYHGPRVFAGTEFQDSEAITERRLPEYFQTQMIGVLRQVLC